MACKIDSHYLDEGFGGETYKRKREQAQAIEGAKINGVSSMETDDAIPPPAKRSAIPSSSDPDSAVFGKPSYDGVIAGTVSGEKKEKRIRTAYFARIAQLDEEIRLIKVAKMKKREEREKKKQENIVRSGNPKTLKKIAQSKQNELVFNLMKLSF